MGDDARRINREEAAKTWQAQGCFLELLIYIVAFTALAYSLWFAR